MWKTTHTETVGASAETIWKHWTNVDNWPKQDDSLTSATLGGTFDLGGTIALKPKNGPKMKLRLALVTPKVGFALVGSLPLATLQFNYHIDETDAGASFTQSVALTGPLAWLYASLMGAKMEQNLTTRMAKLKVLLEQEQSPTT